MGLGRGEQEEVVVMFDIYKFIEDGKATYAEELLKELNCHAGRKYLSFLVPGFNCRIGRIYSRRANS